MRIALCQINPTVGDIPYNVEKIVDFAARAKEQGATVAVFPELAVMGYPPKDLLLKPAFIDDNLAALDTIAARTVGIDVIVGYADRNPAPVGRPLLNAAAILREGKVHSRHFKTLLPTYDVSTKAATSSPGHSNIAASSSISTAPQSACRSAEDLWNDERLIARRLYHFNPIADLDAAGAEIMINCSASPFVVDKHEFRLKLFASQAAQFNNPLVYVNQVGGNDELVFDGNSVVFDAKGNVIAQAKDFEEDLLVVDIPLASEDPPHGLEARATGQLSGAPPASVSSGNAASRGTGLQPVSSTSNRIESPKTGIASLHAALVLGLRDYCRKCNFSSVVLGLSGGIDSALVAALAVHALGKDKVVGIAMPSRFSSDHSIADAKQLAANLGIAFHIVPISGVHDCYENLLTPYFAGKARDITEENLQARIRGAILMAFSNKYNHLLLTTGNKSEVAVGYCTLYGDMCGGLAVISDVPKTAVWEISRWINANSDNVIPRNSIEKPPSAELRPDQVDQDSLPPYDELDAILYRYIEEEKSASAIIEEGYDAATVQRVIKLIDRSEYKRRQMAPGIKVTSRAFGFGRRMPIAQNYTSPITKNAVEKTA